MLSKMPKLVAVTSFFILAALFFASPKAYAATIPVASGNDTIAVNSSCSLSEAIQNINNQAQTNADCAAGDGTDDTITLPTGTITLTADLPGFTRSVTVSGNGVVSSIIDGDVNQYVGFQSAGQDPADTLEFSSFKVQNAKTYGIGVYALTIRLQDIEIENSKTGLYSAANNTELVNVNSHDNNTNDGAGAMVQTIGYLDRTPTLAITGSKFNNNTSSTTNQENIAGLLTYFIGCIGSNGSCTANHAVFSISESQLNNNSSVSSPAGLAIAGFGEGGANTKVLLTANKTTFTGNSVSASNSIAGTAGIYGFVSFYAGSALNNVTLAGNSVVAQADQDNISVAGIAGYGMGEKLTINNSTITNNSATNGTPGTIFPTLSRLLLADDQSSAQTGLELKNTLLADNTFNNEANSCRSIDIGLGATDASPTSLGHNISDDNTCSTLTETDDQNNVTNLSDTLGTLGDHGGNVPTIPLLAGSPAIDAGSTVDSITTDARGFSRPQCSAYDVGAYEYNGTCPSSDDNDGISSQVEDAAPNSGDANNDGTPDSEQDNVASFENPGSDEYAVLEVSDECSVTLVSIDEESTSHPDSNYSYPTGLMDFTLDCGTPGTTATVTQYYYGASGNFVVRKYNPTTKTYKTIDTASISDRTIGGQSAKVATYQVKDGGALDLDNTEDGNIHDPAGLAQTADSLADTGQNTNPLILLSTILLASGLSISVYSSNNQKRQTYAKE